MTAIKIPKSVKALIFDMDGTLVNSEPVGPDTFIEISKKYGVTPDKQEYEAFIQSWKRIGNYVDEKTLLSDFVVNHSLSVKPNDFIKEFLETYLNNLSKAPALTGVDDFLRKAKPLDYKMAIVSASKTSQIETVLKNHSWLGLFDFVIGEEAITKHKPDPEGYLKAIERLTIPADECVIFEDSKNGVIAAKASGAYVIGLREGNAETMDLSAADKIVPDFESINL